MKLFFYAYKSWGHDPIWYFSCLCRKFSELRALLFLSSTQTSQNLKFIQKCPCLSSLKNKFQWTQNFFWPLIRKILIWTFWDYKSSWSKKSTPIQPRGVIGAPLLCIFKRCNSWECSVHFFRGPWLIDLNIEPQQLLTRYIKSSGLICVSIPVWHEPIVRF